MLEKKNKHSVTKYRQGSYLAGRHVSSSLVNKYIPSSGSVKKGISLIVEQLFDMENICICPMVFELCIVKKERTKSKFSYSVSQL